MPTISSEEYKALGRKKRQKYGAKGTHTEDGYFPSKKELTRWQHLQLLERDGKIEQLQRQVKFAIVVNDIPICDYIADFVYIENGKQVVEDAKGVQTPAFRLKRKLLHATHGIDILLT